MAQFASGPLDKPLNLACAFQSLFDESIDALAAARLADKVKTVRDAHGTNLLIDIVAHSMGGLVSRNLLESGDYCEAESAQLR